MSRTSRLAAGILFCVLGAGTAQAGTTSSFDFEDQATTSLGTYTSLTLSNNGLSATLTRGGQPFDIADITSIGGPSVFGARSLAPTPPGGNSFFVSFSKPVSSFSVQMGDFGTGFTDKLSLTGFSGLNGTGTNLGSVTNDLVLTNAAQLGSQAIQFSHAGIQSVEYTGGTSSSKNSVYSDNFTAVVASSGNAGGGSVSVPLPPALYAMPFAAALAWFAGRRLRGRSI